MTETTNDKNKKDSLKELEKLLESDVMSAEDDEDRLIPKRELIGIIIRFSAFMIFALILFFIGIFDTILIVLVAALFLAVIEGINILKIIKARKEKPSFFEKKKKRR